MIADYPVKAIDEDTTKKHFTQTKFYCLRCGSPDIVKKIISNILPGVKITIPEFNLLLLMTWKRHSLLLVLYTV